MSIMSSSRKRVGDSQGLPSGGAGPWWLNPARLCFPEKFVLPHERQFLMGTSVSSITSEPGIASAFSSGFTFGEVMVVVEQGDFEGLGEGCV